MAAPPRLGAVPSAPCGESTTNGPTVLVVFLGVRKGDGQEEVDWIAEKIAHLRIFEGDEGCMDRSVLEMHGEALVVSQFTLYGDVRKGRRPDFITAAGSLEAEPLYHRFVQGLAARGVPVQSGVFGARMLVELENDGPVTLVVETGDRRPEIPDQSEVRRPRSAVCGLRSEV